MSDSALARRLSSTELVAVWEQAERDIRDGFALLARAEKALNDTFASEERATINIHERHKELDLEHPEIAIKRVRRSVWWRLVERLELRRMMSVTAWEKLEKELDKGEPPAVTIENVNGLASGYYERIPEMLQEAISEVFGFLRPPGSKYKTNTELEIRHKVILTRVANLEYFGIRIDSYWEQRLTAIENVFSALDGKGSATKRYYSDLSHAIRDGSFGEPTETKYFRVKTFRNGNVHLEIKRLDLLARFNQIAGGTRLRPATAGKTAGADAE